MKIDKALRYARHTLLLVVIFLVSALVLNAAVSYLSGSSSDEAAGTSHTFQNFTVGATGNLLVIGVALDASTSDVNGATFNGDAMTQLIEAAFFGVAVEIWYLKNPDIATGDIVVNTDDSRDMQITAFAIAGAEPTSTFRDSECQMNADVTVTTSNALTTISGDLYVDFIDLGNPVDFTDPGTMAPNDGTEVGELQFLSWSRSAGRYKTASTTTTNGTWSWSTSTNRFYVTCAASIAPAASAVYPMSILSRRRNN